VSLQVGLSSPTQTVQGESSWASEVGLEGPTDGMLTAASPARRHQRREVG
jgi:hypothetical protein